MSEHIAFSEDLAPETIAWADTTRNSGGISATHVDSAIASLREKYAMDLMKSVQGLEFVLLGAWFDYCLKQMTLLLLTEYNAARVTINTNYAVMFSEREQLDHTRTILSAKVRREQFLLLNPRLKKLHSSGKINLIS